MAVCNDLFYMDPPKGVLDNKRTEIDIVLYKLYDYLPAKDVTKSNMTKQKTNMVLPITSKSVDCKILHHKLKYPFRKIRK